MAGRPPLPIGSHGKIRKNDVTKPGGPKTWRAYCQFRDLDGNTRQVGATASSGAAAERALKAKLAERVGNGSGQDITPDTKLRQVAEAWYETIAAQADAGERSPATAAQYRSLLDRHVLPAVGELRLREATTGRLDVVLQAIRERAGGPTAKSCRTVLSGVLGYAARHDAVTTNATRNTQAISVKPKKKPRALTPEECTKWLALLAADAKAVRWDMVDLTWFMLATGVRIGEALAVAWDNVDLTAGTVAIDWTLVPVKGKPLVRKGVKSDAGFRTLPLPPFALALLRRRAVELFVLQTGQLPGSSGVVGYFCGGPDVPQGISVEGGEQERNGRSGVGEVVSVDSADIARVVDAVAAVRALGETPVFPNARGGWRDPSNTRRVLRQTRGTDEFEWVTSHVFRKTAATLLDSAGLTARQIADQLGHSRPSLTQDVYMARKVTDERAALALEQGLRVAFPMQ